MISKVFARQGYYFLLATPLQRPPNYTLSDRIYPYIGRAKLLNLQGITPQFVVFLWQTLKLGCFVYT